MLQGIGINPNTCIGVLYPYQHITTIAHSSVVIYVDEFEPKHVLQVSKDDRIVGLIARYGSLTCHAANLFEELVLLTGRKLTAIVAVGDVALERIVGCEVELDGLNGTLRLARPETHEFSDVFDEISGDQPHYWRRKTHRVEDYKLGRKWTCYRPQYRFTQLDASLIVEGFRLSNQILFNEPACEVMFDDMGRFWLSGEASPERIQNTIVNDPNWFISMAAEQHYVFRGFIDELLRKQDIWQRDSDLATIRTGIHFLRECTTVFYSWLPLTMSTYEPLFSDFIASLQKAKFPRHKAFQFLRSLSHSGYSSMAFRTSTFHTLQKWLQFPAPEPRVIRANVNFNKRSPHDAEFESEILPSLPLPERTKLITLRKVVPIMFEIKEEKFYVSKAILGWMNVFLDRAGSLLIRSGTIKSKEEMLSGTIQNVLGQLHSQEETK